MFLKSYASGDGSISFVWVRENDRNGSAVEETVTESDVSMFLREDQEDQNRWEHWDILDIGRTQPVIRLVQLVERPFHSSKRLTFMGKNYRYVSTDGAICFFEGRSKKRVESSNVILAMCFFLNNEEAFCRRRAQSGR